MASGAFSQWAETTTMARGLGIDCDQVKSDSSHCGASRVGGAPWLTNSAGNGPSSGVQGRWARAWGSTRARRSS